MVKLFPACSCGHSIEGTIIFYCSIALFTLPVHCDSLVSAAPAFPRWDHPSDQETLWPSSTLILLSFCTCTCTCTSVIYLSMVELAIWAYMHLEQALQICLNEKTTLPPGIMSAARIMLCSLCMTKINIFHETKEWTLFVRLAILAINNRFCTPRLELKCLGTCFRMQKQKFLIPRDSTWPPCD